MKRIITLALAAMMMVCIFAIVGCEIEEEPHVHSFGEWQMVDEASCTEEGKQTRVCACGENEFKSISALGHSEVTVAGTPATCTESGLTEKVTCQVCGEILKKQTVIPSLGHNDEITVEGTPATCIESGLGEGKKCSVCGEVTAEQEEISPLGHKYDIHTEINENGSEVIIGTCQRANCGLVKENPSGLYDADNNLLASWDELVNTYGLKIEKSYKTGDYTEKNTHITYILSNNEELISAKKLVIDSSVTRISSYSFENSTSLEYIFLPASVEYISYDGFIGCDSIKHFEVDDNNTSYRSIDGNLYTKSGESLVKYATGKADKDFILPECVSEIGYEAFSYSSYLTTIFLHNKIAKICPRAFSTSKSVENIYYSGTEEEWENIDFHVASYPNDIVFHYDGITRFMAFRFAGDFGSSGSTGFVHFILDNDKVYISESTDRVLYTEISKSNDVIIEYADYVYSFSDNGFDNEEYRLEILEKIQTLGDWYVLKGVSDKDEAKTKIVCYIDGAVYYLSVYEMNEDTNTAFVNRISCANIILEDKNEI